MNLSNPKKLELRKLAVDQAIRFLDGKGATTVKESTKQFEELFKLIYNFYVQTKELHQEHVR